MREELQNLCLEFIKNRDIASKRRENDSWE